MPNAIQSSAPLLCEECGNPSTDMVCDDCHEEPVRVYPESSDEPCCAADATWEAVYAEGK